MAKPKASSSLNDVLLALVRSGLYGGPLPGEMRLQVQALSSGQWSRLVRMGKEQTVLGLLARAVEHLPCDVPVPSGTEYFLFAQRDRLEENHRKMTAAVKSLREQLRSRGMHPFFLKGLECARFYPEPYLRELGDIDLYLPPDEFRDAETLGTPAPDGSIHFVHEGFDVDIRPRYFDLPGKKVQGLPEVPSPEAELLMLNLHILKHAVSAGVGLRQLCDMALAYKSLAFDLSVYEKACRAAGILRWTRLLSSFLNRYLGADAPLFGMPALDSRPLARIVWRGGNFGHYDASRSGALARPVFRRKADTFFRLLRSVPFSLQYAPLYSWRHLFALLKGNFIVLPSCRR